MKIFDNINEWKQTRKEFARCDLGFVPTMGFLHEGHISLIKEAKKQCKLVAVSIYVNPTQFNSKEDFDKYPSNLDKDISMLKQAGVDFLFLPKYEELYPDEYRIKIQETELSKLLCGEHRPGHFDGVLSVVMKLLNIISPAKAFFGKKDFQQWMLIQEMTRAYFIDTEIVGCEIIREEDGLAMSSRNSRLSAEARKLAPEIYKLLSQSNSPGEIREKLTNIGFSVDYVSEYWGRRFIAASIENVRLIDNVEI